MKPQADSNNPSNSKQRRARGDRSTSKDDPLPGNSNALDQRFDDKGRPITSNPKSHPSKLDDGLNTSGSGAARQRRGRKDRGSIS